jgi:folate-dependent phosphoribosylglycinamide formyltransferase PurN
MNINNIKIHYSLLPAFDCAEPIKEAFLSGVKVSGVTIIDTNTNKILAQYPVLIGNTTHFDEFEAEMLKVGEFLYNKVVEAIEKDKVFDFSDLLKNRSCHGNCGGCKGCH